MLTLRFGRQTVVVDVRAEKVFEHADRQENTLQR
jgi:hypothetical protein